MCMDSKYFPRVLVLSVNAFRSGGSNGKVLAKYFGNWPADKIAQFYTYAEYPDIPLCTNYFRVTDKEVIKSVLTFSQQGNIIPLSKEANNVSVSNGYKRKFRRNPLTLLIQDFVWNLGFWKGSRFKTWVKEFNPEVIVVFATGSSFMNKIALSVSKWLNIPYVIFNTENYYFKDYNYFFGESWGCLFPLFKFECKKAFDKLMLGSSHEIYPNELLERLYGEHFKRNGTVLYQSSDLHEFECNMGESPKFTYAGNLGLNRHKSLIEIAETLQSISRDYYLDVYGRTTSDETEVELKEAKGIRYHGAVPYSQVVEIMKNSHFLVHCESFDEQWIKDLSAGFSTKISDILTVGRCLILYADASIACAQYVKKNNCGCVINSPSLLREKLSELLADKDLQNLYIKNGLFASRRDMNFAKNADTFYQILCDTVKQK